MAPVRGTTKAHTGKLSKLNSRALALAVYASQRGLPHYHARLASGSGLSSPGQACLPARFHRKVSELFSTSLPPFPSFLGAIPISCSNESRYRPNSPFKALMPSFSGSTAGSPPWAAPPAGCSRPLSLLSPRSRGAPPISLSPSIAAAVDFNRTLAAHSCFHSTLGFCGRGGCTKLASSP